jgi:CheY-like chemotaxis protein
MTTRITNIDAAIFPAMPRPNVYLLGATSHPDFQEVVAILRQDGDARELNGVSPELVVFLQELPVVIRDSHVATLRRKWPLAGFVAVAGSWCEGELRTGKPLIGVPRVYWHEFPAWWQRQMDRRALGRCPQWIAACASESPADSATLPPGDQRGGVIVLSTPHRETADVLSETLQMAGHATVWTPPGRDGNAAVLRGVVGGVWDGGQLCDREVADLERFSRDLSRQHAPVIALLDFPRWDSRQRALDAGAAAVLGKPWLNADLLSTIDVAFFRAPTIRQSKRAARAA